MNVTAIENQAREMAAKAKPGHENIDGKLYTFAFCQRRWVYEVYEDGFLYVTFNTKTLPSVKKMLREWLAN